VIKRNTRFALALLPLLSLAVTSASPAASRRLDIGQTPVVVLPTSSTISAGDVVMVTVTISGTTTTDQVVDLYSNSSLLPVRSSVTILAGHNSATFVAYSTSPLNQTPTHGSNDVTITATCNNGSTYGYLTVTY